MIIEKIMLNAQRNVTLTAFLQDVGGEFRHIAKRPAVLVLPGGGYSMCSEREADPVALAYLQAGYQAFVLRYSVGAHAVWPNPLNDYEQAMELICGKAEEWKLYPDKVAVIGFSAGGHLAGAAATMAKNKPCAAILGYPAVEGDTIRDYQPTAPDIITAVDSNTAPCFVFATRTDNIVPISNTLKFTCALAEKGIGFESHIYAFGPHGFSIGNSSVKSPGSDLCGRAEDWVADSIGWLKDMLGDFGTGSMTAPKCGKRITDDFAAFLSVDCTVTHLMANAQARTILMPMMEAAQKTAAEKYGDQMPKMTGKSGNVPMGLGMNMTLRAALAYGNVPKHMVEQLNAELKKIPNR